jgi:hypothetical protein
MSQSNFERCKAWIANKPEVDAVREKLATVEDKLLALSDDHPKRDDIEDTMQALLVHLKRIDESTFECRHPKAVTGFDTGNLSSDLDPCLERITDPLEKRKAFELLKSKLGSGMDLLSAKNLAA